MTSTPKNEKVVCFDAMYTLFEADGSRAQLLAKVFKEEAGLECAAEVIWEKTRSIRFGMPSSTDYKRDWRGINERILRELGEESIDPELPARIQRRILYDARLYSVSKGMRKLLQDLFEQGVPLGIHSNQDCAALEIMLATFDIGGFFQSSLIFTSDRIGDPGETISKPHQRFWELVREKVGLSAEDIVIVGNSVRNDLPAKKYGHSVIIFDRCGHQADVLPEDMTNLFFCRKVSDIRAALKSVGVL